MESFVFNKPELDLRMPNIKYKKPMSALPQHFLLKSMKDLREIAPCYGLSVCDGFDDPVPLLGLYSRFAPRPCSLHILAKDLWKFAEENREEVNEILSVQLKGRDVMAYLDELDLEKGDITLVGLITMMDKLHVCVLHKVGFWVSHDGSVQEMKSPNPDLDACTMYLAWMKQGGFVLLQQNFDITTERLPSPPPVQRKKSPPKDVPNHQGRSW